MQLSDFLNDLHFHIDNVRPPEMSVNWGDAPLPFKLYQGLPVVELPSDISLPKKPGEAMRENSGLTGATAPMGADVHSASAAIREVSGLLWYTYGLTGVCQAILPPAEGVERMSTMQLLRRYVPSGGGLYPSELYAYLKIDGLPRGIYHYDVAHHRLIRLREGNYDAYLERALGHRCPLSSCFGAVFVSTLFWKNFYKYNNFSYRLQGLDAGVLIGQLLEVCKHYGYKGTVYLQFLDTALSHLLGLNAAEESVYAVVPLSNRDAACLSNADDFWSPECAGATGQGQSPALEPGEASSDCTAVETETAEHLCGELPRLLHRYYLKSKKVLEYPTITAINDASMFHSTESFAEVKSEPQTASSLAARVKRPQPMKSRARRVVALPKPGRHSQDFGGAFDTASSAVFEAACHKRYSPGLDFVPEKVSLEEVARLLWESTSSFGRPADVTVPLEEQALESEFGLSIACCSHGIDGLDDGAYIYDSEAHALRLLREGDHRLELQKGMSMPNVNLFQVPLCVHLVGHRNFYQSAFNYRGYRMQQMEVGMLLQRLLLTASAIGLAGHPLLGYDENVCDDIYDFSQSGQTCLIQVPVGHYRKTSRFESPLRA